MTEKQQKRIWLLCAAVFLVFCTWVGWFIGVPMIRMAEEPDAFRLWVDSHGILGRIVFVSMVIIQVLVAFIPGEPVELLAGYAFGVIEGSLLTMAGFLLGSWLMREIFLFWASAGVFR